MAQIANIVLNDGKATPVAHTFTPQKIEGETAFWENSAPGVPLGFEGLQVTVKRPKTLSGNGQVYRVTAKVMLPTLEVTSPATGTGIQPGPTLAYTTWGEVTLVLPARGTAVDRKDLRTLMIGLLQNAIFVDAADNLRNTY